MPLQPSKHVANAKEVIISSLTLRRSVHVSHGEETLQTHTKTHPLRQLFAGKRSIIISLSTL